MRYRLSAMLPAVLLGILTPLTIQAGKLPFLVNSDVFEIYVVEDAFDQITYHAAQVCITELLGES
jgi:hypothetical protein